MERFKAPDPGLVQTKQSQNENEGEISGDSFIMFDLLSAIMFLRRRDYNTWEVLIELEKNDFQGGWEEPYSIFSVTLNALIDPIDCSTVYVKLFPTQARRHKPDQRHVVGHLPL